MGNTHLGDEEGLTGVTDAPDQHAQRLELFVFRLLDTKIRREKIGFVPVVHLQSSKRTLNLTLGVEVNPPHPVGHNHTVRLVRRRLVP